MFSSLKMARGHGALCLTCVSGNLCGGPGDFSELGCSFCGFLEASRGRLATTALPCGLTARNGSGRVL